MTSSTWAITLLSLLLSVDSIQPAKLVEFGSEFPHLVKTTPDKGWLVKFYAPWCYHCQQLEPAFVKVSEYIHHNHQSIIVGRLDCTKHVSTCQEFGISSYPTILHVKQNQYHSHRGDRTPEAIIDFALRLNGPDIQAVSSCDKLRSEILSRGLIILSTESNKSSELHTQFNSLAKTLKSSFWFYHFDKGPCKGLFEHQGVHILKRDHNGAIRFEQESVSLGKDSLREYLIGWIKKESLPVYGPISSTNLDQILGTGKTAMIAILDEYKPAKKFSESSKLFNELFRTFARQQAQRNQNSLIFGWSSDLGLIASLTLTRVAPPNVLVLKPDLKYHLLVKHGDKDGPKIDRKQLDDLLKATLSGELELSGGNSYINQLMRLLYSIYTQLSMMYSANPLLTSVLVVMPSLILIFVIYTTCFHDYNEMDDERVLVGEDESDKNGDDHEEANDDEKGEMNNGRKSKLGSVWRTAETGHPKQD